MNGVLMTMTFIGLADKVTDEDKRTIVAANTALRHRWCTRSFAQSMFSANRYLSRNYVEFCTTEKRFVLKLNYYFYLTVNRCVKTCSSTACVLFGSSTKHQNTFPRELASYV